MLRRPSAFTINAYVTSWQSKASTRCPHQNGRPWSEREVRILRRDYGKPGRSVRTIAAKLGRTCQSIFFKGGSARFELAARISGVHEGPHA